MGRLGQSETPRLLVRSRCYDQSPSVVTVVGVDRGSVVCRRQRQRRAITKAAGRRARVQLRNLATGGLTSLELGDPAASGACPAAAGSVSLLMAPTGVAVWHVERCTISSDNQPQPFSAIHTADGASRAPLTLDSDPGDGQLANLRLEQCVAGCSPPGSTIAWWTDDGSWRMAKVS